DKWTVESSAHAVSQIGYVAAVGAVAVDTSTGNANNVTLSAAKATTLLYGTVTDSSNAPVAGLDLVAIDEKYLFQASAVTDSSGNYVIAISGGVWAVDASGGGLETRQDLASLPTKLYTGEGQAANVNFSASKASAQLSGALKDNNGAGISDINYRAIKATPVPTAGQIDTRRFVDFGTQADGSFGLGLTAGTWTVQPLPDSAAHADLIFVGPTQFTLTDGQNLTGATLKQLSPPTMLTSR
ncbi:MAG: carboxypeptidase-like regulatory domain-containing protein, partial [Verrucomicrobiota bacterium]|nr:carboxypeptidase-like regulatory domain-containing protein [Verrucomicrobiota bacterium]